MIPDGLEFELYENNSAPCSKCYFFNFGTLSCALDPAMRECIQEQGTKNGWNTLEYRKKKNASK